MVNSHCLSIRPGDFADVFEKKHLVLQSTMFFKIWSLIRFSDNKATSALDGNSQQLKNACAIEKLETHGKRRNQMVPLDSTWSSEKVQSSKKLPQQIEGEAQAISSASSFGEC